MGEDNGYDQNTLFDTFKKLIKNIVMKSKNKINNKIEKY